MPSPAQKSRHEEDSAFVLHTYPYSETSLIVEMLTRQHGRLGMMAKGAKRPRSALRGMLLAFQPLLITWFGKSELRTLGRVEWREALPQLSGTALMCGFYMNELILKLTHRDDPHETLFDFYSETMGLLRAGGKGSNEATQYGPILRRFELRLLKELGYAVSLDKDIGSGETVVVDKRYEYLIEQGPVAAPLDANRFQLRGQTLLDMAREDYTAPTTLQEAKQLMRRLVNHYLGGQTLHTRQLLRDLREI
ncbi:MAG: DNA repair protein RecO [Pseudomonadota bacterium]